MKLLKLVTSWKFKIENSSSLQLTKYCEAQGKGRDMFGEITKRYFIDYLLSIIEILSQEITLNLVATHRISHPQE